MSEIAELRAQIQELHNIIRGMMRRVTMKNVNDGGKTQTASIEVADGVWRDGIEVMQPYGFASHVGDGALGLALALGGDEGDIMLMPVANPSARMGKLDENEVGLYNAAGDKFVLGAGGEMTLKSGQQITIKTDAGVFITAQILKVEGDIEATGDVKDHAGTMQEMRDKYNVHNHTGGPPPTPLMD
ncbi:phage baseplate assembly protein domain-containing protein [Rhizobium sp. C1]|uniref:phage baseplate assembly protein domain-containing protein n=1 Tax=Rhizobium sp. C1 TaxID=1349799 RepID=UPI001E344735|nr:phage baseplate assembly protein [Rhizobium sp. C1]MCD2176437.1 phage baseplate assembly protein [Rhizobium sp. C1]